MNRKILIAIASFLASIAIAFLAYSVILSAVLPFFLSEDYDYTLTAFIALALVFVFTGVPICMSVTLKEKYPNISRGILWSTVIIFPLLSFALLAG